MFVLFNKKTKTQKRNVYNSHNVRVNVCNNLWWDNDEKKNIFIINK